MHVYKFDFGFGGSSTAYQFSEIFYMKLPNLKICLISDYTTRV